MIKRNIDRGGEGERVDKFIDKANTSNKLQHNATVSIRGTIKDHTAPRDYSPNAMAEHQLRLVINTKLSKYRVIDW